MPDATPAAVVLQIDVAPPEGSPSGLRVDADGWVNLRSDQDVSVDVEGRATRTAVPLQWRRSWRYDGDALAALRAEVDQAAASVRHDRYAPPAPASHPTVTTWTLARPGGPPRRIVVEGHSPGPPEELQRLYTRVFALRDEPAATSVWTVRTPAGTVVRHVDGEPAAVPALRPLVGALFARPDAGGPAVTPADDAVTLVEVEWRSDGRVTERTRVLSDGRNLADVDGRTEERRPYGADELAAVTAAIAAIGWDALPDPLVADGG